MKNQEALKKSNPDGKKIHLQRYTDQKLSKIKARESTFWRNLEAELKSKGNPLKRHFVIDISYIYIM